ncbi:Nn.00g048340.m01.CDS01 [Neocucurbitaria sp. VM-36]
MVGGKRGGFRGTGTGRDRDRDRDRGGHVSKATPTKKRSSPDDDSAPTRTEPDVDNGTTPSQKRRQRRTKADSNAGMMLGQPAKPNLASMVQRMREWVKSQPRISSASVELRTNVDNNHYIADDELEHLPGALPKLLIAENFTSSGSKPSSIERT